MKIVSLSILTATACRCVKTQMVQFWRVVLRDGTPRRIGASDKRRGIVVRLVADRKPGLPSCTHPKKPVGEVTRLEEVSFVILCIRFLYTYMTHT